MQPLKPWWKSKTVWINVIGLFVAVLTAVAGSEVVPQELAFVLAGLILPVLNVILRWLTDEPISSVTPKMDKLRPGVKPNPHKIHSGKINHELKS